MSLAQFDVNAQLKRCSTRLEHTRNARRCHQHVAEQLASRLAATLRDRGFICSPEQLEVRRLMIAEAARSGTGKLFFDKISTLRAHVSAFLSAWMASGTLRADDPDLAAADHLGALLEAEILEPLLLHVREVSPEAEEITLAENTLWRLSSELTRPRANRGDRCEADRDNGAPESVQRFPPVEKESHNT